jgi:hypothetical protein
LKTLHCTDGPAACYLANMLPHRIVVNTIGDHQLDIVLPAGIDHLTALGRRDGHGLFAQHMLAGLGGAHGVLGVHAVR